MFYDISGINIIKIWEILISINEYAEFQKININLQERVLTYQMNNFINTSFIEGDNRMNKNLLTKLHQFRNIIAHDFTIFETVEDHEITQMYHQLCILYEKLELAYTI